MSLQEDVDTFSFIAGAAIGQYLLVTASTLAARTAVLPALGASVIGATLNKATAAGQALTVGNGGIIKVVAGAAVALGANVAADTQGRAITAVAGQVACGKAITAAANAGEIIEVMWLGPETI